MILASGSRLGPYDILSPLGVGGFGEVYKARDTRLDRTVAIKILPSADPELKARFEREARAIAALTHPHICTLYDIGHQDGTDYLVMEYLEGETLARRIERGPIKHEDAFRIASDIAAALKAAHERGVIHRDLKPANIIVRVDGSATVLDFGLAKRIRPPDALSAQETAMGVSAPGYMLGTVAYMAPEQVLGQEVDARTDLFAFGIILYEMIAGRHPWPQTSVVDTLHAILHDEPPAAEGPWNAVVATLLRKNPRDRYANALAVLDALANPPAHRRPPSRVCTRLVALPFRQLRVHEASAFLSVSLPDAISSSLVAVDSVLVRSPLVASRFASASGSIDVQAVAEHADVDAILTGTILSDGQQIRVSAQLLEAPSGTVLWTHTSQGTLSDLFGLQDELVDRIVRSLALPLNANEQRALKHDAPGSAMSYELYLRANQLATGYQPENMVLARDLYLRAVDIDPNYAPAWASLGRIYRIIGKYGVDNLAESLARAEEAFQRSFALNPDLPLVHNYYTSFETDLGRHVAAMQRLLKRARTHRHDPNIFAGLVHACRYCGLLEASIAAHHRAMSLDAHVRTTVPFTYLHLNEFQRALDACHGPGDEVCKNLALVALDRHEEAIASLRAAERATAPGSQVHLWIASTRAVWEGDVSTARELLERALLLPGPMGHDPEGAFFIARQFVEMDEPGRALEFLSSSLDRQYGCQYALMHDVGLNPLRSHRQFTEMLRRAAVLDAEARAVFLANSGNDLLEVQM